MAVGSKPMTKPTTQRETDAAFEPVRIAYRLAPRTNDREKENLMTFKLTLVNDLEENRKRIEIQQDAAQQVLNMMLSIRKPVKA